MSEALLTIQKDGETIRTHELEGESVLGRGEGCGIRLDDRAISRQHVAFRRVKDGVLVERKSEFAPLVVNGVECTSAIVTDRDLVGVGPYVVRVSMGATSGTAAPTAAVAAPVVDDAPVTLSIGDDSGLRLEAVSEEPASASGSLVLETPAGDGGFAPMPDFEEVSPALEISEGDAPAEGGLSLEGMDEAVAEQAEEEASEEPVSPGFEPAAVDEDAATKFIPASKVQASLVFPPGAANVTEYEITRAETTIGRGKNCDIVLEDKKASRTNSVIKRSGASFTIVDLDSSNGTYVNGEKAHERELSGDDRIRIGDVEFVFKAKSAEYEAREADFLSLASAPDAAFPQEVAVTSDSFQHGYEAPPPPSSFTLPPDGGYPAEQPQYGGYPQQPGAFEQPGFGHGQPQPQAPVGEGIPGITGMPGAKKGKFGKNPLPKRTKNILYAALAVCAYVFMFDDAPKPVAKAQQKQAVVAATGAPKAEGLTGFDALSPEQQRFVETQHSMSFDLYRGKEYDRALYEIRKIFKLVSDYKDSREIERYAIEGKRKMEALEEERRRKEEEAQLKARIAQLVDEAGLRMKKKQYEQTRAIFPEILALDPDNLSVGDWEKQIKAEEERKRELAEAKRIQEEINKEAWKLCNEALALQKAGKYHSAIKAFRAVGEVRATDKRPVEKAKKGISESQESIRGLRDPVLAEAKQLEASGELAKAYQAYKKTTRIDPPHPDAHRGIERIRGVLSERAKALYTEAVVAESYSDFEKAAAKFRETLATAPEDDLYYERAKRKLGRYPASIKNPPAEAAPPSFDPAAATLPDFGSGGAPGGGGNGY